MPEERKLSSEMMNFGPESAVASTNTGSKDYYIDRDLEIRISDPKATAIVIQPFIVEVAPSEEEYLATSRISNSYELGETSGQAVSRYLKFLVDELVWLQEEEENLSPSIHEDLRLLQKYLRIV